MSGYIKTQSTNRSLWLALSILAAMVFSAPLWSADTLEAEAETATETVEKSAQPLPENSSEDDQSTEQPETAEDFKPNEEISEDFPVPLPSDI